SSLGFELWRRRAFGHAVPDTNEFQHGADASISQPRCRQTHDSRVASGSIREARRDDFETDLGGRFAAQKPHDASAGFDDGSHRCGPLLPLAVFPPAPPLVAIAIGRRAKFLSFL